MPFTVSHAAAVLPIRGRWLSASALVIATMIPDLPLFLPMGIDTGPTHTIAGVLTVNLALGLLVFVMWHGFFARPADWFAPSAVRKRLAAAQQPGLRVRLHSAQKVAGVIGSLLIGQATHLFLDLFTHPATVVTDRFGIFYSEVAGMPVYFAAQLVLSVAGLVLLGAWAVRWYQSSPTYPLQREPSALGKIAARSTVVGGAAGALLLTAAAVVKNGASVKYALFHMSVATVVVAALASILVAGIWHLRRTD